MKIKTRIFDIFQSKYENLSSLAEVMELSTSYLSRVRNGKRSINEKFIIGAKKAFPELRLEELFYFVSDSSPGSTDKP